MGGEGEGEKEALPSGLVQPCRESAMGRSEVGCVLGGANACGSCGTEKNS